MAGSPAAASRRILTTRLLNGTLTVHGEGHMSSIEYRLGNKFAGRYISSTAAQRCLQQKLVAFVGDSRIRFLYAAFISLLANHNSSRLTSQPRHTLCPLDNQPETHVGACAAFYNPGPRLFRFQAGSTHVVYGESHHGVEQEAIVASRAHVVLADVGAWQFYGNREGGRVIDGTASQHIRYYDALRRRSVPGAVLIAVGYPWCSASALQLHHLAMPEGLQRHLEASGWLRYVPERLTSRQVWGGRHYGRAWCDPLLPERRATKLENVKWDQCEGAHTYDTLADLEVQILLSLMCG